MKRVIVVSCALVMGFSVFAAQAADVYGSVGVDSNYINKGVTNSNGGISPNALVGVGTKVGSTGTAYTQMEVNYVDFSKQGSGAKFRNKAIVGFKNSVADLAYSAELSRSMFTGNTMGDVKPSQLDVSAVDLNAEYQGVFGKYSKELAENATSGKNAWYQIGYHKMVTDKLDLGIAGSQKYYGVADVTRYNNTELTAAYDLTKQVKLLALYSVGGKDVNDVKIDNKASAGVKYEF